MCKHMTQQQTVQIIAELFAAHSDKLRTASRGNPSDC